MKRKKQRFLGVSLATCLLLAGCMNPPIPKDAYMKGVTKMEEATTYQKSSTVNIETETTGVWEVHQTVLFALLNESTLEAVTVTDKAKEQSETTLHLSGGFDYVPIDTTLHLFFDEKKQKTYMERAGLAATFAPYVPLSPALNNTWIELGTKKQASASTSALHLLLQTDFASAWSVIPTEKFSRSEVSLSDKKTGIRDVVTLSLQDTDLRQAFPAFEQFSDELWFERVTVTAFLDRKGNVVKEKIETKFTHKEAKKALIVHASILSTYDLYNETVQVRAVPKAHEIRSFDALFETEKTTETKTEKH